MLGFLLLDDVMRLTVGGHFIWIERLIRFGWRQRNLISELPFKR